MTKMTVFVLFWLFGYCFSRRSNMEYLDIGVEYIKITDIFYWSTPVTVQLVYEIPRPQEMKDFTKPRCDYVLNARRSLFHRFQKQFPQVVEFGVYKQACQRYINKTTFSTDTDELCHKCFHISSDNDPFYLECVTLLELRHLCKKQNPARFKRDTKDSYRISRVAVMLAESAKMQDDRLTATFRKDHGLQKESVNFQLLLLNTVRWKMSLSELWFLHYIESEPETFAKILVHLSGILPETRALTERRLNASLAEPWKIAATERNESHVIVNVTFTSFNPEYKGELYRFRFLPVNFSNHFLALNSEDDYSLKCDENVVLLTHFEADSLEKEKFVYESPCHNIHETSILQKCMTEILSDSANARKTCFKNAVKLHSVNDFYFTLDNHLWFPQSVPLSYNCPYNGKHDRQIVKSNTVVYPRCGCFYSTAGNVIPQAKTCSSNHVFKEINVDFTFGQIGEKVPFFLGQIQNGSTNNWSASSANRLSEKVLIEAETVRDYFRKKLEKEASTSGHFKFSFGISTFWFLIPIFGIIFFSIVLYIKCKRNGGGNSGFANVPGPIFINHCDHGSKNTNEHETIALRNGYGTQNQPDRVVSWPAEQITAVNRV